MRIAFVYPRFRKFLSDNSDLDAGLVEYFLGDFTTPPSLGIPILAALTPPEDEVVLVDDNSGDPVDFDADFGLVAINCFTPQATRALELADGYRAAGKKVVMGGFFPSFMVEECLKHADAVNVGEGEPTWPRIVEDARQGRLERVYRGGCRLDLGELPTPRRDLFYGKESYDWDEDLVQVTRGCMYTCAMCAIPAHMGQRMRFRPIDKVVDEIRGLKYENVYLADDSLFFPQRKIVEYSTALLEALVPLGKKYFVSSTMALNTDKELLDLMARAGVRNFYCTMNVDPVSIRALRGGRAEQEQLVELVKKLEDRGIRFFGSCALGRDWDDESIADRILELYDKAAIRTAEFFLFTPYPGSVHWDRMERQGRIIDRDWSRYNGAHVVFRPLDMSPEDLQGQFTKVWNEFFRQQRGRHVAHLEPQTWKDGKITVGKPLQRKGVKGEAVVTGIGILCPIGNDPRAVLEALRTGRHGISPIDTFDASPFRSKLAGRIRGFDPADALSEEELAVLEDDYLRYAVATARAALADAGIEVGPRPDRRIAMVLGTCNGGLLSAEEEYRWKHGQSPRAFDERLNLQAQYYGFGKALAWALGVGGETWVVTTACSSSAVAIGLAQMLIRRGYYDTVLVGGSDSLSMANLAGFDALKATSAHRTAPFSVPVGLNVGEASCFWVVEEMEKAFLRQAHCLGRIVGHATTADAYHPTSPDPRGDGAYRTLRGAVEDAGLRIEEMGCINAHGTGTEANDRAESRGIARLLGETPVPVVSTKSFFGHCMGSAGILEATCGLLAMNEGFVPPTINYTDPRPGCGLDYVPNEPRAQRYDAFVSSNYAFGGNNAAVVLTTWDKELAPRRRQSRRVMITGVGCVCSLGLGIEATLERLGRRECGIGSAERISPPGLASLRAGLVPAFDAKDIDRRLDLSDMNDVSRYATAASRLAFDSAGLRVSRRNAEELGIALGMCNGPPETRHMDSVFTTENHAAHIGCFSNIVANSVAGWVSNALCLKGANVTLSPGPHAGLQCLGFAFDTVADGRVRAMVVGGADEVYDQTYYNYDLIGFLCRGEQENDYRLRPGNLKEKVLGEGAAVVVLEAEESARERGAPIYGELLGYGMGMDAGPFAEQNMACSGLVHAARLALERAGVGPDDIDLVVWGPQGNAQDLKVLEAGREVFGERFDRIPLAATSFNTGYIESASSVLSLACALSVIRAGSGLWPQITGVPELDERVAAQRPRHVIALAGTDVGYNYAVVAGTEVQGS